MNPIIARINDEPVLLVTLIQAVLTLLVVFGLNITKEQVGAILGVSIALLGIWARGKVTPVP